MGTTANGGTPHPLSRVVAEAGAVATVLTVLKSLFPWTGKREVFITSMPYIVAVYMGDGGTVAG